MPSYGFVVCGRVGKSLALGVPAFPSTGCAFAQEWFGRRDRFEGTELGIGIMSDVYVHLGCRWKRELMV